MKMKYEKPAITVERYELTQTIAACGIKIGFVNGPCVTSDPHATEEMVYLAIQGYFTAGVGDFSGCAELIPVGEDENGMCYHTNATTNPNASGNGAVFNS